MTVYDVVDRLSPTSFHVTNDVTAADVSKVVINVISSAQYDAATAESATYMRVHV